MTAPKVTVKDRTTTNDFVTFDTAFFEVKWSVTAGKGFAKKLQKLIDDRNPDWTSIVYQEIGKKMKLIPVKESSLDTGKLQYEETLIAVTDAFIKKFDINTVPKQKTIDEVTAEKPVPKKAKLKK